MIDCSSFPSLLLYGLFFLGSAVLFLGVPAKLGKTIVVLIPIGAGIVLLQLPKDAVCSWELMGTAGVLFQYHQTGVAFSVVFLLAAFVGVLFAIKRYDQCLLAVAFIYIGSALGVLFAFDWISIILFVEVMAVSSAWIIYMSHDQNAVPVSKRYLLTHLAAGTLLLYGALWQMNQEQSLLLQTVELDTLGSWIFLLALSIKIAFPMFHKWMVDGYSVASAEGTVLIHAFTSKIGIYLLLMVFAGTQLLFTLGILMILFSIIAALFEQDMRRALCYSSITQLGMMTIMVGFGTEAATNAIILQVFVDVMAKSLLFMAVGVVLLQIDSLRAFKLGGLFKSMPIATGAAVLGGLTIAALPWLPGYVSKSLIMDVVESQPVVNIAVWIALLLATSLVWHYVAFRVPYLTFFRNQQRTGKYQDASPVIMVSMLTITLILVAVGVYPTLVAEMLPYTFNFHNDFPHIRTQTALLLFAALSYCIFGAKRFHPVMPEAYFQESKIPQPKASWILKMTTTYNLIHEARNKITKNMGKTLSRIQRNIFYNHLYNKHLLQKTLVFLLALSLLFAIYNLLKL